MFISVFRIVFVIGAAAMIASCSTLEMPEFREKRPHSVSLDVFVSGGGLTYGYSFTPYFDYQIAYSSRLGRNAAASQVLTLNLKSHLGPLPFYFVTGVGGRYVDLDRSIGNQLGTEQPLTDFRIHGSRVDAGYDIGVGYQLCPRKVERFLIWFTYTTGPCDKSFGMGFDFEFGRVYQPVYSFKLPRVSYPADASEEEIALAKEYNEGTEDWWSAFLFKAGFSYRW